MTHEADFGILWFAFAGVFAMLALWMHGESETAVGIGVRLAKFYLIVCTGYFFIYSWEHLIGPFCKARGWIGGDE